MSTDSGITVGGNEPRKEAVGTATIGLPAASARRAEIGLPLLTRAVLAGVKGGASSSASARNCGGGCCAVVEDSGHGVAAARAAGMRAFGFAGGITPVERLAGPGTVVFIGASGGRELEATLAACLLTHQSKWIIKSRRSTRRFLVRTCPRQLKDRGPDPSAERANDRTGGSRVVGYRHQPAAFGLGNFPGMRTSGRTLTSVVSVVWSSSSGPNS